jgi:hypothetical protein
MNGRENSRGGGGVLASRRHAAACGRCAAAARAAPGTAPPDRVDPSRRHTTSSLRSRRELFSSKKAKKLRRRFGRLGHSGRALRRAHDAARRYAPLHAAQASPARGGARSAARAASGAPQWVASREGTYSSASPQCARTCAARVARGAAQQAMQHQRGLRPHPAACNMLRAKRRAARCSPHRGGELSRAVRADCARIGAAAHSQASEGTFCRARPSLPASAAYLRRRAV